MTLQLVVRSFAPDHRTDRISQDFRAYIRSEWQGDSTWLRREPTRVPVRARFRSWLAARRPTAPTQSHRAKAPESADSTPSVVPAAWVEPCPHPDAEELGLSGGAVFLRCLLCGDVLVVDRGRGWSLGSDMPPTSGDRCQV